MGCQRWGDGSSGVTATAGQWQQWGDGSGAPATAKVTRTPPTACWQRRQPRLGAGQ